MQSVKYWAEKLCYFKNTSHGSLMLVPKVSCSQKTPKLHSRNKHACRLGPCGSLQGGWKFLQLAGFKAYSYAWQMLTMFVVVLCNVYQETIQEAYALILFIYLFLVNVILINRQPVTPSTHPGLGMSCCHVWTSLSILESCSGVRGEWNICSNVGAILVCCGDTRTECKSKAVNLCSHPLPFPQT